MGDFMFFKTKASSIFSFFLFTIFFTLLLACGGGSDKKNGNDSGSENPVVEDPIAEDPILPPSIECPTGYIAVPSNSDVGVDNDFCVMKYEAKNKGAATTDTTDDMPVSKPEESPVWSISQNDARSACKNLNSESNDSDIDNDTGDDGTYALISNPEWMTIARNIENVDKNWTSGTVGTGCLFRGNVGATVPCQGGVESGYDKGSFEPDFGLDRPDLAKLTLDNGEEIWDFSGNIVEFIDWNVAQADKAYVLADESPINSVKEFTALDTKIDDDDVMSPNTWQPTNPTLDSTNGIGRYNARGETNHVAVRGGNWGNGSDAGVFALGFNSEANTVLFASFRCVYRP